MNNNDEFEKLINSFRLEDPDEGPGVPSERKAPSQRAPRDGRPAAPERRAPEGRPSGQRPSSSRGGRDAAPQGRKRPEEGLGARGAGRDAVGDEPQEHKPVRKVKKKKYRVFRGLLIALAITGFCFYLAFFALDALCDYAGINQPDNEVTVDIPEGASLSEMVSILHEKGVLSQPLAFRIYAKLKKVEGLQFGEYIMTPKMPYDRIISVLKKGEDRVDVETIVIQEGATLVDIAQELEKLGICEADEFIDATQEGEYNFEFLQKIGGDDPLRFYRLEGYLFPNTHQMFLNENPNSVVKRFLQDFNDKMTADLYDRMNELNMTLEETITLASIIQKEAGDPEEMAMVSGVFHNRLNNPGAFPRLESDPTIFYVERVIKKQQELQNQEMYDAYNTYVCEGLPEGPICNPGMEAIEAALNPEEHGYYFFITDNEGKYYYAVTMEEHEANIAKADQVNAELAAQQSSGE